MASLLTNGLVTRGHDVTLFATSQSQTQARMVSVFERGYNDDPSLYPWELCELMNLSAAVERADQFDVIHYQAEYWPMALGFTRTCSVPVIQTLHHAPSSSETRVWLPTYADAPFIAISNEQARLLEGANVIATIHHAVDMTQFTFNEAPDDYVLFLGRFTPGKGVLEAIEVARRARVRLVLAAARNAYFDEQVAPHVDGFQVMYAGEVSGPSKDALIGGARALLYPVQASEPFGLVLAEAAACGTPTAALALGAVREVVEPGVTGVLFDTVDDMIRGLPEVMSLDRAKVRRTAERRFGIMGMVDAHVDAYRRAIAAHAAPSPRRPSCDHA